MTSLTPTNRQSPLHFIETVAFIIAQISVGGECLEKEVFHYNPCVFIDNGALNWS
jgi:hypothetical protein